MGKKMFCCRFCGAESENIEDFEEDIVNHAGYWCPWCDGFTFFRGKEQAEHRFRLILESKENRGVNVTRRTPDFPTQVSPLRWPGGKSKLIGAILERCEQKNMENFVEPFAGGASAGLALLLANRCKNLYINDIDYGIYALFKVIKEDPAELIRRIRDFAPTKDSYMKAQKVVHNYGGIKLLDAAWNLLVCNRLAFSGIPRANCMGNPSARWNPNTLIKRIENIHAKADRIFVSCTDACAYIEEMYWKPHTTIFIDPPYFFKGKDLYMKYYEEEDHDKLAFLLDELYKGMPGADMLLTYDESEYIKNLYRFPVEEIINRNYCIAN